MAALLLALLLLMQQGASPAASVFDEATRAARAGDFKAALPLFSQTVSRAEADNDDKLLARALVGLGWAQWGAGQYDTAYATHERALTLFRAQGDAPGESLALLRLGETLFSRGRFADALERYDEALAANRRAPNPVQEASILSNRGSALRFLARYDEAAQSVETALQLFRDARDEPGVGQALTFLGIVHRARGEYGRAVSAYLDAAAIRQRLGDKRGQAQVLGNLGNVYLDLGQYERAAEMYLRSHALAEESGYTAQIGFANQSLGNVLARLGRTPEALARHEKALEIWRRIDRKPQIGWTLREIGIQRLYALRDPAGARAAFEAALAVARAIGDDEMEGYLRFDLGDVAARSGAPDLALGAFGEALAFARKRGSPNLEYEVLAERGRLEMRAGRTQAAIDDLRASAAIVSDMRAQVASDDAKIAFLDTRQSVFQDLAIALMRAGRAGEALEVAESSRARAFADLLESRQLRARAADRQALEAVRAADVPKASAALGRLRSQNAELASLVSSDSPRLDEIRGIAQRLQATLVEYLVTERALLIWVVTPSGALHDAQVPVPSDTLAATASTVVSALNAAEVTGAAPPAAIDAALRELHRVAIEPIERWLPGPGDLVIVVPHGPLALVPFAALAGANRTPLVERYTLASAPAAAVFRYTAEKRRQDAATGHALILAAPDAPGDAGLPALPGTLVEGRLVATRLAAFKPSILTGADASERAVKQRMRGAGIVHFATHGLVSEMRPSDSSLVLAEGGGEDGYLRAGEIFGLELDASLVVLSGCSTGRGRLTGDGIFGLSRAFMYAGTPAVVVSLWDVSDQATAFLMDRFYAEFARSRNPAASLRTAQRAARQRYPHPSLWAPFMLVGEPR